jgi:hypothetical protein
MLSAATVSASIQFYKPLRQCGAGGGVTTDEWEDSTLARRSV